MGAKYTTKLILASRSGGVCAFPKCGRHLTYEAVKGEDAFIGEAAHICGKQPDAPRYDVSMTDDERNGVKNLIYLCAEHHTIIDKVEADWPTEKLYQLKEDHENRVVKSVADGFEDVAFPSLKNALTWVTNQAPQSISSFDLLPMNAKIKKNTLSNGSRLTIIAGLVARDSVANFIKAEAQIDPDYPERLKAGFLERYFYHRKQGYKGDELFELMCAFAKRGLSRQADKTAAIAVLIYLFEICDVFEK